MLSTALEKMSLSLLALAISITPIEAEPIDLICYINFNDGENRLWEFTVDVENGKMIGLRGGNDEISVEKNRVIALIKQRACYSLNGTHGFVCAPDLIIIDRRTLEIKGSLGNENDVQEIRKFNGQCIIGKLEKKF